VSIDFCAGMTNGSYGPITAEQKIFYLSNDILQLSLKFGQEITIKFEEQYKDFFEIFRRSTIHCTTTKNEFIFFFNIFYTQFYGIQLERNKLKNDPPKKTIKAIQKSTYKESKEAVEILRKIVIQAFLDAYCSDSDEFHEYEKQNFISIKAWSQDNFKDSSIFTRLKYNEFSGY
jgi:hypothetical protein